MRSPSSVVALVALVALAHACACAPPRPQARAQPAAAASSPALAASPNAAGAPRATEPLVVALVVDQMAAWIAAERWPALPDDGGFARLRREGTWARDVRYAHAATDTAPGHASLFTGAPPRASGIFGNEVIDAATGERVSILHDASKIVTADGVRDDARGSSAAALRVDTVADRLRAARPDAVVVSLSLKDRGAIFAGGRAPTASIWFDRALDRFVTSTAFARAMPAWMARAPLPAAFRGTWTLLDPPWVAAHARTPDDQDGEGSLGGMGITFPHPIAAAAQPANAFRASPFADDALLALALRAVDAERAPAPRPTLIAVSLSANDYVGHAFGPDSWEAWDELRRLDASLARFFAALDARVGPRGWSAILTADHGTTTMPEAARLPATRPWCAPGAPADRWQRACGPVGRVLPDALATELRAAAQAALGPGRWVRGVADPYVYLDDDAERLAPARRDALVAALTRAILAHAEVDRVIDTRTLPSTCPGEADDAIDALVCRAYAPGGGALYVVTKRGSFFDPSLVVGKGTSHGSPYLFDRAVPLVVRAPGRADAGAVRDAPLTFRAFARTLATLLGVEPPDAARDAPDLARP